MKEIFLMNIPEEIKFIIGQFEEHNLEAYIVGGCVRDAARGVEPNDWDIAVKAEPKKIQDIFKNSFLNNKFGTVTVLTNSENPRLKEVEITPFRVDEKYSDKRHPDKIKWVKTIEEDLGRRDFTINAMAIRLKSQTPNIKTKNPKLLWIDPFEGKNDLENNIIRAVRNPKERFSEDALRMLRAVRFAVTLSPEKIWQFEQKTEEAIKENANLLTFISKERIRDELVKIISCPNGARGIEVLRRLGLLSHIIPELEQGFGVGQNKHHIYQIYPHSLLSLNYACEKNFSFEVRMAALLHDIGKPKVKSGEGLNSTFYNHEIVGARMAEKILKRLKFPKKTLEKIVKLVRYHLFYYSVGEVGESSVRRLLRKIGTENVEDLLRVRQSDRIGSGVPKAEPYKLRHLRYVMEKVSQDPLSAKMLKANGKDVMKILKIGPGPKVGKILTCLLGNVLKNPKENDKGLLKREIIRLGQEMSDSELDRTYSRTRSDIEEIETKRDKMTKDKYWVS